MEAKAPKGKKPAIKKVDKAVDPATAKANALAQALGNIEKNYGRGAIMKLGDENVEKVEVIPSGSIGLNYALGVGGYPKGRIIEIYGPESSGKTTLAIHAIAEAQKKAANSVAMPLLMGNVAFQSGHYADASSALNSVLTHEQGRQPGVYNLLAECLVAQGRGSEAIDYVSRAIAVSPKAHFMAVKARAQRSTGNYAEALKTARNAQELNADDADALTEEALALIGLNNYGEALVPLAKILDKDPENIYALTLSGLLHDMLKDNKGGIYYNRAASVMPQTTAEKALKGLAQIKSGKTLDGDATLREMMKIPDGENCYWAAVAYANSGDKERAAALAKQARDLGFENIFLLNTATGPLTLRP